MTVPTDAPDRKPWPFDDPLGRVFELLAVLIPLWVATRVALELAR